MSKKSVVLLSGGLDSTVNLYEAHKVSEVVLSLTFDYGQRALAREIEVASWHCERLGIPHRVLKLDWFQDISKSSLTDLQRDVPVDVAIDSQDETRESARSVWVSNRNGVFLNIGAAFAEGLEACWVIPGFNREEAQTFPDNSEAFIEALNRSLLLSTSNQVQVKCFTADLDKPAIAKRAVELGVDLSKVWPCYFDGPKLCGVCESCLRFQRATKGLKR